MSGELAGLAGVVTGGSSGIGRAIAEAFTAAGARVAIYDVDGAELAAAAIGAGCLGVAGDVTDERRVAEGFEQVAAELGRFDFLVNNAGIRHQAPIVEHPVEIWRRTIEVNLTGTFICSQAAAREMLPPARRRLDCQSGLDGRDPRVAQSVGVQLEQGRDHRADPVDGRRAGLAGDPLQRAGPRRDRDAAERALLPGRGQAGVLTRDTPQGRWGQVSEIAGPAVFLCSAAAAHIHGATLSIDGGWVAAKGY